MEALKEIAICGYGYVGKAIHNSMCNDAAQRCTIYDKVDDKYFPWEESVRLREHDVIFICLPTPYNRNYNHNKQYVQKFLYKLFEIEYKGLIIIKSTIPYEDIQKFTAGLNIVFSPEFLNASTSSSDFYKQKNIIIGADSFDLYEKTCSIFEKYFSFYRIPIYRKTSIKAAISLKYARNIKNAMNVLYWNLIEDISGYESIDEIAKLMEYVPTDELSNIWQDGFRGYGGACLPKDIKTVQQDHNHPFLKAMESYNRKLKKEKKK